MTEENIGSSPPPSDSTNTGTFPSDNTEKSTQNLLNDNFGLEELDPNDPNYKHQRVAVQLYNAYSNLPPGWSKNTKTGTKTGEAPFIHEDGRISWKNPNYKSINEIIEAEEERKELEEKKSGLNPRLLKKYRLMVKRGVPIEAVKQKASLIDNLDFDDSDLLATADDGDENSDPDREQKDAMIEKCKKMIKNGVPFDAVKQMAQRDLRVGNVDFLIPHCLSSSDEVQNGQKKESCDDDISEGQKTTTTGNEAPSLAISSIGSKPEDEAYEYFKPSQDHNEVEFTIGNIGKDESHLARLIQKMILTVNKSKGGFRNHIKGKESILTASTKDLYNALGGLRGVQVARDTYNSTCGENYHDIAESEMQSKRKPFLELLYNLGARSPTRQLEKVNVKGLDELVAYIEQQYDDQLKEIRNTLSVGMYDFDSLTEIYRPGSRVVAKSVFASGVDMICEVSWNRYEEGKTLFGTTRSFKVCIQFIVAVGEHFTMCEYVETVENFDGRKHIQSLNFVPLLSYDSESYESIKATFRRRGEIYAKCATGANYMAYDKGSFFAKGGKNISGTDRTSALRMTGRVMVDTQGSYEAGHSISIGNDSIITDVKHKYKEYMLLVRAQKKKGNASNIDQKNHAMGSNVTTMILFDKIPADYLEMTWPAVVGFSFTSKSWGEVLIDGLNDVEFNESAFDNLVLPKTRKRMVKALVRHSNSTFSDIISGKGEGSVFLLYGPPGCGKTLTAEAISEMLHRPLYSVSLGQLGVSASELETRLGEILDLCSRWDALILLDEADTFLEKRSSTDSLERNAMVSVMLKLVEYFKGTLFLTSNRVDVLDPAFKTRITLGLHYDQLDYNARKQVWINLLHKSGFGTLLDNGHIEVEGLAMYEFNGREIKNAIRLSMALAEEDQEPLSQILLLETIETLNDFNTKMNTAESY